MEHPILKVTVSLEVQMNLLKKNSCKHLRHLNVKNFHSYVPTEATLHFVWIWKNIEFSCMVFPPIFLVYFSVSGLSLSFHQEAEPILLFYVFRGFFIIFPSRKKILRDHFRSYYSHNPGPFLNSSLDQRIKTWSSAQEQGMMKPHDHRAKIVEMRTNLGSTTHCGNREGRFTETKRSPHSCLHKVTYLA